MKKDFIETNIEVTDFQFSNIKWFNLLISDKMFRKLRQIQQKESVKDLISLIIARGTKALANVTTSDPRWTMFQHLINVGDNGDNSVENTQNSTEKPKKRKHSHHFAYISMLRSDYEEILATRNRLNTFSMALIIRLMVDIFFQLFAECGDKNVALEKLAKAIADATDGEIECNAQFVLLKELNAEDQSKWRAWAYFRVECFDKQKNLIFSFKLRL